MQASAAPAPALAPVALTALQHERIAKHRSEALARRTATRALANHGSACAHPHTAATPSWSPTTAIDPAGDVLGRGDVRLSAGGGGPIAGHAPKPTDELRTGATLGCGNNATTTTTTATARTIMATINKDNHHHHCCHQFLTHQLTATTTTSTWQSLQVRLPPRPRRQPRQRYFSDHGYSTNYHHDHIHDHS